MENQKMITFADIRPMYGTGRSIWVSGTGRDKKFRYRNGIMTPSGDIEESEWQTLAKDLISQQNEDELHQQLCEWLKENTPWPQTKAEMQVHALELHVSRIFDNPQWVDFIPFNRMYRPEVLEAVDLVEIRCPSCSAVYEVTKEQYLNLNECFGGQKYCRACEDWVIPELVGSTEKIERSLHRYECE